MMNVIELFRGSEFGYGLGGCFFFFFKDNIGFRILVSNYKILSIDSNIFQELLNRMLNQLLGL